MPWLRPIVTVYLCSSARFLSAASNRSTSAIRMSVARASCTDSVVSSTSDDVMPWCTKRASGPISSARWVVNAMVSCRVSFSISSMRAGSILAPRPRSQIVAAASFGMTPNSAIASAACASISKWMRYLVSSDQSETISARA